ncbi:hypothetical protein MMC24_000162 [Lignoscripta atroalba]|nr:hypothetical protein [Lignoscripta atroalba]
MRKFHTTVLCHYLLSACRCRKSLELHDKRHREIAGVVQRIHQLEETTDLSSASPLSCRKRKTRKSDELDMFKYDADMADEDGEEGTEVSTTYEDETDVKGLQSYSVQGQKSTTKKDKKAEKRAVKNRARVKVITTEDITRINEALHPVRTQLGSKSSNTHSSVNDGLTNNSTIDNNIAFNTSTFRYASLRQAIHAKKLAKWNGVKTPTDTLSQDDSVMEIILGNLLVSTTVQMASKEGKALIAKLREAIQNDLTIAENEDRDTMMRMAGYWRYVNRRTYNYMVRNNELWDWSTGAKLEEIEEDDEVDEPGSQLEGAEPEMIDPVETTVRVESYDDDFVIGTEELSLVNRESFEEISIATGFDGVKDTRHLGLRRESYISVPEPISSLPLTPSTKPNSANVIVDAYTTIEGTSQTFEVETKDQDEVEEAESEEEEEAEEEEEVEDNIWSYNPFSALSALSSDPPSPPSPPSRNHHPPAFPSPGPKASSPFAFAMTKKDTPLHTAAMHMHTPIRTTDNNNNNNNDENKKPTAKLSYAAMLRRAL